MNREIQLLRDVIVKLVPMLTGKGLKVTQRGTQAYVTADPKTNRPVSVNIPSIPDTATEEFIKAVAGFIDHEVGHVLFTDWAYYGGDGIKLNKFSPEGRALTMTHNIVEDPFVERKIVETFPGAEFNLDRLHRHFLEKVTAVAVASAKGKPEEEFNYLIVPMIRALSGQEIFQEFMDKGGYWKQPLIENLHLALSDEALELIKTAQSTKETLEVAQEIHDILFNNKKKDGSPVTPPKQKGKSQDKPEKKAEEGDGDGERDHSESEPADDAGESSADKGDGKGEDTEGKGTSSKSSKSKEEDAAEDENDGEEGAGAGEGEDQDEDDESEGQGAGDADDTEDDESEDGAGAADDDKSEDGAEDGAEDGDDEGEAEDGESEDEGADGESEDADGDDADGDGDEEGDETDETDEGEDGEEELEDHDGNNGVSEDETDSGADEGGVGGDTSKSVFDLDPSEFNPVDLSQAIAGEIQKMAQKAIKDSPYTVFTKDEDQIELFKVDERYIKPNWVPEMDARVMNLVGPMQKNIERIMAAQSLSVRTAGHRSGRLHSASLYRISQGDDRVFQRKQEHTSKDTAVMLLIDNSGSMTGSKIVTAMLSGYALAQTLERVGIASEIIGFTTGAMTHTTRQLAYDEARTKGIRFDRMDATVVMPIYKTFNERVTPAVKKRIAFRVNVHGGMNTNIDGESLQYAAERLIPRRERRKVMLVLSDGMPVGSGTAAHLKKTVQDLTKMGIETVGLGIESEEVKHFYPRSLTLNDVTQLPGAVMTELKRILTN